MKYKLTSGEIELIEDVNEVTGRKYVIDERYIKVKDLIYIIEDLKQEYDKLEDKFIEYDTKANEDYRLHFIDEQINKGMHPHEYE